jgi:hypothetical protein
MSDDTIVIPTSSRSRPVPEAGEYGQNLPWEADLQLWKIEPSRFNPGYDKEGEFAPYFRFTYRISLADGPNHFVSEDLSAAPNSGSAFIPRLDVCGVPYDTGTDDDGEPAVSFSLSEAAPRKLEGVGIELGAPQSWEDKNTGATRTKHGRIINVFGRE